jgi:pilus assembly protein CpaE
MRTVRIPVANLTALAQPTATPPDVLVIDLRDGAPVPPSLSTLKRQHPSTGVVMVTESLDPSLMIEGMRAGVNECVTDLSNGDLEAAIARLSSMRTGPESGEVIAFLGAKGGIGTTTLAVNVAAALAKIKSASTLLIDLHLACGDAAVYLGAEPRFSVMDALDNTHRLDAAYFRSLVSHSKFGVDLLASADRPTAGQAEAARVHQLIDFAARNYRFTILDVPRSDAAMLDSLSDVSEFVVLANQELATVRSASRIAPMLRQRYGKDKVTVVLSRSDRLADIGHEDVERAVATSIKHVFSSDYRAALRALNRGQPLVLLDPQNGLAQAFQTFARDLAGLDSPNEYEMDRQPRLFSRLTGRR